MAAEFLVCIVYFIFLLFDINRHNQEVEKEWPDNLDQHQFRMRDRFRISPFGYYFFLILLIGLMTKHLF